MFERFTEDARRSIFFARYEAGEAGANTISSEHLMLGIVREYSKIANHPAFRELRSQIHPFEIRRSHSVDMPLTSDLKRVLALADEESRRVGHHDINCGHLLLGLLDLENCAGAKALHEIGIDAAIVKDLMSTDS